MFVLIHFFADMHVTFRYLRDCIAALESAAADTFDSSHLQSVLYETEVVIRSKAPLEEIGLFAVIRLQFPLTRNRICASDLNRSITLFANQRRC